MMSVFEKLQKKHKITRDALNQEHGVEWGNAFLKMALIKNLKQKTTFNLTLKSTASNFRSCGVKSSAP